MDDRLFPWMIIAPWVWIAGYITVSVLVRRHQGKPIFPRKPEGAVFSEVLASGWSDGWRALGGARNCLLVWIDKDTLTVVPFFPFNLGFVGDVWGLEQTIPRRDVLAVDRRPGILSTRETVVVTYRRNLDTRRITLRLRDTEAFMRLLMRPLAA